MDFSALLKRYYKAAIVVIAVTILYRQVLLDLFSDWWNDSNYSHGLVLPFVVLWLIWRRRRQLESLPSAPSNFGLAVILGSVGVYFLGFIGAELFLMRTSLLFLICGLVLFFFGWRHLKMVTFPIAIMFLAIPLPAVIFYQLTFPLQLLASKLGSSFLEMSHVPVLREGNVIVLPNITLEVAEACSGVRSLFTLATLTILYGYLLEDSAAMRIFLIALTIPLALFCNGLRIMGTGVLAHYVSPEMSEGFFHTFSGWFIFVVALASLVAVHKGLRLLWKSPQLKNETAEHSLIPT